MKIIDFGLAPYKEILQLQEKLFNDLKEKKIRGEEIEEHILAGEHYPVITLGRRAKEENLLAETSLLNSRGIEVYHIGRGGDITYHCPGQVILYPILDLERHKLGVKDYVHLLEEMVIKVLSEFGIKGERVEGATGVWIGKGTENERKICAMGIKCSRFCTMHGLALNVNSDLSGFNLINPCGFKDKAVTSVTQELALMRTPASEKLYSLDLNDVKQQLIHQLIYAL